MRLRDIAKIDYQSYVLVSVNVQSDRNSFSALVPNLRKILSLKFGADALLGITNRLWLREEAHGILHISYLHFSSDIILSPFSWHGIILS